MIVTCAQIPIRFGRVDHNNEVIADAAERARALGTDLLVLPELASTGYMFRDRSEVADLAETTTGKSVQLWANLSRTLDLVIVAGFAERDGGHLYNSAVCLDRGKLSAVYRKTHLWDAESDLFTPGGENAPIVTAPWGRAALSVCYDVEFPEWTRSIALRGADLIAAPVTWPDSSARPAGERPGEIVKIQAAAAANRVFIAACDRSEVERDQAWVGGSAIVGPTGHPLAMSSGATPQLVTAEADLERARDKRIGRRNHVFDDRRLDLYPGHPITDAPRL